METKICTKCKRELPLDMFRWKIKSQGKKHSQCKECQSKKEHQYYRECKERREAVLARAKTQKENNVDFIERTREQGCAKCGEKRKYVLDFHHVDPSIKTNNISHMIKSSSIDNLIDEVNKCVLLCANCHREYHYLQKEQDITLLEYLGE